MTDVDRPLVTFALFAYEQEEFIREATLGALAQTYSPLQIILSDDCSQDRTYEIMREVAEAYNGPHAIILNRNPSNLGLGAHINRVIDLAKGEIVVAAAGDDVSLPQRTDALVRTWLSAGNPLVICSEFTRIDEFGDIDERREVEGRFPHWLEEANSLVPEVRRNTLLMFLRWELPGLYGATACWARDIFRQYGSLRSDVWYEDRVLFLRAILERKIAFRTEALVRYRRHVDSFTQYKLPIATSCREVREAERRATVRSSRRLGHLHQHCADLTLACEHRRIDKETFELLNAELKRQIALETIRSCWWESFSLQRLCVLYPRLLQCGDANDVKWARRRLLPLPMFVLLRTVKHKLSDLLNAEVAQEKRRAE